MLVQSQWEVRATSLVSLTLQVWWIIKSYFADDESDDQDYLGLIWIIKSHFVANEFDNDLVITAGQLWIIKSYFADDDNGDFDDQDDFSSHYRSHTLLLMITMNLLIRMKSSFLPIGQEDYDRLRPLAYPR